MNKFHSWSTFEEYIRNCNPNKGQSQSESYHWKSLDKKSLFITFIKTLSNFFGDIKLSRSSSSSRFSVRTRTVRLASDTREYRKILWRGNRFFYGFGNEFFASLPFSSLTAHKLQKFCQKLKDWFKKEEN